jgi:probable rRNA maturation factor
MSAEDGTVLFLRASRGLDRRALRVFAVRLTSEVTGGRPFTCLITDDRELRRLNRQFLGAGYPTDVLSFPSAETLGLDGRLLPLGELAVSVNRADEQARAFGHSLEEEICVLMLHGVLHLAGMDHARDRGQMKRAEIRWRRKLGLPAGLIERTRP